VAQRFVPELLGRSDYAIIGELIEQNTRVLDLGCGEGELLAWLAANKRVDARGVEISGPKAQQAIARGVSVFHSDLENALADLPDQAFDYVILSQTLQETHAPLQVLRDMLRVGFPEFRPLARAPGASLDRPRAQDQIVSLRLVRFAEHPFSDGSRFRGHGIGSALDYRTAHLPRRPTHRETVPESDGRSRRVLAPEVGARTLK
jgi:SAM-dependent methyltransferase